MMAFDAPLKVIQLLEGYLKGWCVAGGWSIDLFLGYETRLHDDVEILIYRHEQLSLQAHLGNWPLNKVVARGPDDADILPWQPYEWLSLPIHQIRSLGTQDMPEFDLMLNEGTDEDWIYRRNTAIKRSRLKTELRTTGGIPYLAPEVALLYKAHHCRKKDQHDFEQVYQKLNTEPRHWLIQAIKTCYPDHVWLEPLQALDGMDGNP